MERGILHKAGAQQDTFGSVIGQHAFMKTVGNEMSYMYLKLDPGSYCESVAIQAQCSCRIRPRKWTDSVRFVPVVSQKIVLTFDFFESHQSMDHSDQYAFDRGVRVEREFTWHSTATCAQLRTAHNNMLNNVSRCPESQTCDTLFMRFTIIDYMEVWELHVKGVSKSDRFWTHRFP